MINGIIAVVLGYLLGSIPSAYIATRVATGKDVRQLGGGNVGGLNVYREVGAVPALAAGIADVGKGAAAVAIAQWLLDVSLPFILLTALAAVAGHNWMVFLKFSGGKGMGAAIGALSILFPLYGYPLGLAFFFGIVLIPFIITRNVALSMGIGLVSLPFIAWLGVKSTPFIIFSIALGLIILVKFIPTARAALAKVESKKDFIFDHRQRGKR
ncbi:MAG: glycerol-3-phosphate acyltransferase [Dehalococcoidia bacterium]|nr:glycerol-3-phosphate acyltransferase [Dehalococcoidia bacterium]